MIFFDNYQKSKVVVGESFKNLNNYVPHEKLQKLIIITDSNVVAIYADEFPDAPVIVIGTGEKNKTGKTVDYIIERLIDLSADRHAYLVGIGGGIVCDITGYVASIYMRGISFGYVSTSLLSQIDASIGGKTGINFHGFKNLVGVFSQPDFVICDTAMLHTLPAGEIDNGLAEAIKHAIIQDDSYFSFIEEHVRQLRSLDRISIEHLVTRSIEIKTAIVTRDEKEKGERKKLNFGHTYGHAIESLTGIPHGHAVSIGMIKAAKLSVKLGYCNNELIARIEKLLKQFDLPIDTEFPNEALIETINKDKKRKNESVDFVFLKDIGEVEIHPVTIESLA